MDHGVHCWKRVHGTIEKERAELATRSTCLTYGAAAKLHQVTWGSHIKKSEAVMRLGHGGWLHKKGSVKMSHGVVTWVGPCSPIPFRNMRPGWAGLHQIWLSLRIS